MDDNCSKLTSLLKNLTYVYKKMFYFLSNSGYDTEMQHAEKCPSNQLRSSSSHKFRAIGAISLHEIRLDRHFSFLLQ